MTRRRRRRARKQKGRFLPIGFQHATVLRKITNKNKQKGGGKKRDIKELDLSSFISEEAWMNVL